MKNKLNILLINPKFPPSYWGNEYSGFLTGYSYVFPPLGLATVAALSQPHNVTILDENTTKISYDDIEQYDIVGITGYMIQADREFEICTELKKRGAFVVIGGPNAFLIQERCVEYCDVLVKGESELIWPQFLNDFQNGTHKSLYEEKEKIDIRLSPKPRFDLLDLSSYSASIVQTTRGCPFSCDFCDIIVMYGKRVREKPIDRVLEEIDSLRELGKNNIFFADDNFVGNKRYAKRLLAALIEYNKSHGNIFSFYTQVSINLAHDKELLELMHKARFQKIFIGIETPRKESLSSAGKKQNLRNDIIEDVRTIQSYNILIMAGMIVGFDFDDPDIFQEQIEFLQEAGIPYAMIGTLQAIPHTPLYNRLLKEERLLFTSTGNNFAASNFIPKLMTMKQLLEGYVWLANKLYTIDNFKERMLNNIKAFKLKAVVPTQKVKIRYRELKIFLKTLLYTLFRFRHLMAFSSISITILRKVPSYFPQFVAFYLGYVHISKYLKKHAPSKKDIRELCNKINTVKESVQDTVSSPSNIKLSNTKV